MLLFQYSKIERSIERPVATGSTVTAEGQALVQDAVNGGVKPSAGAATEIFAGVSFSQQLTPLALPKIESLVVGASNTVTLAATPLAGTIRVVRTDTGAALTAAALTGDGAKYTLAGAVITVDAALAGKTLSVTYRFAPTTVQVKAIQGDIPPGGAASSLLNSVGVIQAGDVFTTEYDTSVDWTSVNASTPIKLAANGLFTVGGSGIAVPNAFVVGLPSSDAPYLGVHFSV